MAERKFRDTTRDGHPVRLHAMDGEPPFVILGDIKRPAGWKGGDWTEDGWFYRPGHHHPYDLIPLREPSSEAVEASLFEVAAQEWMKANGFSIPRTTIAAMLRAAYAIDAIEPAGE